MVDPLLDLKNLLAILTRFWSHLTFIFMCAKVRFARFKWAILAFDFYMCFALMIFFVGFGYNLATLAAFVINTSALDFVHAVLARLDLAFAVLTLLSFFCSFNHLNY